MSVRVMSLVFEAPLPPNEKIVMLALADYADDLGGNVRPSVDRLVVKTTMSRSTVRRMLDKLEENGFLTVEKKPRQHQPAHYRINLAALQSILLTESNMSTLPVVRLSDPSPECSTRGSNLTTLPNPECSNNESRVLTGEHQGVSSNPSVVVQVVQRPDDAQRVVVRWAELFEKYRGSKPLVAWAKEKARVGPLIRQHGADKALTLLDRFFASDDEWVLKTDFGIGAFIASFNRLAATKIPIDTAPWFGPNLR